MDFIKSTYNSRHMVLDNRLSSRGQSLDEADNQYITRVSVVCVYK